MYENLKSKIPSELLSLPLWDKSAIDYMAEIKASSIEHAVKHCRTPEQLAEICTLDHGYGIENPKCDSVEQSIMRLCDPRWWRKRLKRKALSVKEWHAAINRHVGGSNRSAYVGDDADNLLFVSDMYARKAMEKQKLSCLYDPEKEKISLWDVAQQAKEGRIAELYTFSKGIADFALEQGMTWCMTTLKLPGEYHPNPKIGRNSYNGSSFEEMHEALKQRWKLLRTAAHDNGIKIMGLRVTEAHKDGCPHWHVMVYMLPEHRQAWNELVKRYAPAQESDISWAWSQDEAKAKGKGIAGSASYLLKYIVKAVATNERELKQFDNANDLADHMAPRVVAKRRCHGWRAFQFFGIKSSLTSWRVMRSATTAPETAIGKQLFEAASAGKARDWLALLNSEDAPRFAPLRINTGRIGRYGEEIERTEGAVLVDQQGEILEQFVKIRRYELDDQEQKDELNKRFREAISAVISNCARKAKIKSRTLVFFDGGWVGIEHKMDEYDESDPPF